MTHPFDTSISYHAPPPPSALLMAARPGLWLGRTVGHIRARGGGGGGGGYSAADVIMIMIMIMIFFRAPIVVTALPALPLDHRTTQSPDPDRLTDTINRYEAFLGRVRALVTPLLDMVSHLACHRPLSPVVSCP